LAPPSAASCAAAIEVVLPGYILRIPPAGGRGNAPSVMHIIVRSPSRVRGQRAAGSAVHLAPLGQSPPSIGVAGRIHHGHAPLRSLRLRSPNRTAASMKVVQPRTVFAQPPLKGCAEAPPVVVCGIASPPRGRWQLTLLEPRHQLYDGGGTIRVKRAKGVCGLRPGEVGPEDQQRCYEPHSKELRAEHPCLLPLPQRANRTIETRR
jgi:hypothetical protein